MVCPENLHVLSVCGKMKKVGNCCPKEWSDSCSKIAGPSMVDIWTPLLRLDASMGSYLPRCLSHPVFLDGHAPVQRRSNLSDVVEPVQKGYY